MSCSHCPTVPNASQDPTDCVQSVINITAAKLVKSTAIVRWRTTHEVTPVTFNVVKEEFSRMSGIVSTEPFERTIFSHIQMTCNQ